VVANAESNNVTVLLSSLDSSGNLLLKEAIGSPYTMGNSLSSIVLADFNGDGNLDFAVANEGDSTISFFKGDGTGGFTEFPGSPIALGGTLAIDSNFPSPRDAADTLFRYFARRGRRRCAYLECYCRNSSERALSERGDGNN